MTSRQLRFFKLGFATGIFCLLTGLTQHFFFPSAARDKTAGGLSSETQAILRHNNLAWL